VLSALLMSPPHWGGCTKWTEGTDLLLRG
jgi:hypothetical protein